MSKLALINRQYKREKLVAKYAKKRAALEAIVDEPAGCRTRTATPRGSSCRRCRATPIRRGCATAARSPAVRAACTASSASGRNKLREYAMRGEIPGIVKASW